MKSRGDINQVWTRFLPRFLRKSVEGRSTLQNIIGNTGWLFADKLIRMGVALLVNVWVARYLGPEQFGTLSYAIAFAGIFSAVATLGLDGIVVRDIVRDPAARDEILGTAFRLKLAGGAVALAIAVSAAMIVRSGDSLVIWLVGIVAAGTIFQTFDVIDFWFQSQVASKYTVYARNAAFLLIALVKVILILMKAPLIAFALAGLGEIIVAAAGLVIVYKMRGEMLSAWRGSRIWAGKLLKWSWPLILSGAVIAVYMRIDQIMLGEMLGSHAVGLYSVAVRVSEVWYFIPGAIVSSVFPAIVRAKEENHRLYMKRVQQLYTILIWISLVVAIPFTFLSDHIIALLFGAKYSGAGSVLAIHIWTALFVFYGVGKTIFIQCENMQLYSFVMTAICAAVNVALNLLWIRNYGVIGSAMATLSAQALGSLVLPLFVRRDRVNVRMFFRAFTYLPVLYRDRVL